MTSFNLGKLATDGRGVTSSKAPTGKSALHALWPVLLAATAPLSACAERVAAETRTVSDSRGEQDARAENDIPKQDASNNVDADGNDIEADMGAGGSSSPFVGDDPALTPPGQPSTAECEQPEEAYRIASSERCLRTSFKCAADQVAFADACGCGCFVLRSSESSPARVPIEAGPLVDLPAECNGPSGMLARFTEQIGRLSMTRDEVYLLVGRADQQATWRVSKRDGSVSLLTAGAAMFFQGEPDALVVTAGGAVARSRGVGEGGDGFTYSADGTGLVRAPTAGGATETLFSVEDVFVFIAFDGAFFGVADTGTLFHAALGANPGEPLPVEQRGAFDDDDYSEILGLDEDAVYWFAGADPELRTSDGDSLALFRTCRPPS